MTYRLEGRLVGALAMLSEYESIVPALLELKRGVEIVIDMVKDEDEGVVHRGLVVVRNLVCADGENGVRGRTEVVKKEGVEKLKETLKKTKNPELLSIGVEALKVLVEEEKRS